MFKHIFNPSVLSLNNLPIQYGIYSKKEKKEGNIILLVSVGSLLTISSELYLFLPLVVSLFSSEPTTRRAGRARR
jgi:hypothetical protein